MFGSRIRWLLVALLVGGGLWWLYNTFRPRSLVLPVTRAAAVDTLEREVRIVTLLPKDGIPAIFKPRFLAPDEADEWYGPDELVLGVEINGEARAYSIPYLSRHEIVNDTVGGRKIAVTW